MTERGRDGTGIVAKLRGASRGALGTVLAEVLVFLLYLGWAAVVTRPLAARLTTHTLVGPDPLSHLWILHWLTGHFLHPSELFHGNIYHPARYAVMFTDLSMGTAALVWPLRLFVQEPVVLFNLGTLLALAFSGWAFQALTYSLAGHRPAAILAGLLAAFNPHQMNHVYHLNLLSSGWLALFLLGLHRLAGHPGAAAAALTGLSFALNAQSSGYYAVAATLLAVLFALLHWRQLLEARAAVFVGVALALAALLTLPYVRAFLAMKEEQGLRRPLGLSRSMSFQPDRDLTSAGYLYGELLGTEGELLFPGLLPLVLAAVALAIRPPKALFYAAAALVLLVVSLGPELTVAGLTFPLPYSWLFGMPPLDSMRHPYTFAAVATFMLAILAGLGACPGAHGGHAPNTTNRRDVPTSRSPAARRAALGVRLQRYQDGLLTALRPLRSGGVSLALILWAAVETLTPPPRLRPVPPGLPPAYEMLESLPPGPVLEVPVFTPETVLWAARHGRPVVNGIGAFVPAQTMVLERYVRNHWIDRVPEDLDTSRPTPYLLDRFPVRYVIVPMGRLPWLAGLATAFDRSRRFRLAAVASDGDRIYEVQAR